MSDMITERTPFVIAAEINTIKYQTEKILLAGAVEIGRRLTEAKALLPHGEWSKWLEDQVNFTQRTAQNLMRIYEEYGDIYESYQRMILKVNKIFYRSYDSNGMNNRNSIFIKV